LKSRIVGITSIGLIAGYTLYIWFTTFSGNKLNPDYSTLIVDEQNKLLRAYLSHDDIWRFPIALEKVPDHFLKSLLCIEDKRFNYHPGVDPLAIGRATVQNIRHGKVVSGGSTITMQLARLLKPKKRNLLAKFEESYTAFLLTLMHSKEEVLNLYLTYAPYGGNIEGLAAASQRYFNHSYEFLSVEESLLLLTLPQRPSRIKGRDLNVWRESIQSFSKRLVGCGLKMNANNVASVKDNLPPQQYPFPFHAPHLSDSLIKKTPYMKVIETTIKRDMQATIERYVRRQRRSYYQKEIRNISVIVVEIETGEIKAAVGNFDYKSDRDAQKITSFFAKRSPGSTLKPFLYGAGLDQGHFLPEQLLKDVRTTFGGYTPSNYSGKFQGLVRAEDVLAQSLNVPFVSLLKKVGIDYFLTFLETGGLPLGASRNRLGLSVIIGGVSVTPYDMTQLYLNLANQGRFKELRYIKGEPSADFKWLSEGSVFLTNRALARRDRPDFPRYSKIAANAPEIRWKTGTSQNRRDAWSIGYDDQHVVSVWLGNLDNSSSRSLVGGWAAAPVLFNVFSLIRNSSIPQSAPVQPMDLIAHEVCAFSGFLPTPACTHKKMVLALEKIVPSARCPYHKNLLVTQNDHFLVHPSCKTKQKKIIKSFVLFPEDIKTWFDTPHEYAFEPRPHPLCKLQAADDREFEIKSPTDSNTYYLFASSNESKMRIPLKISSVKNRVFCFLNGAKINVSDFRAARMVQVGSGYHTLYCTNPDGDSDKVQFQIKEI